MQLCHRDCNRQQLPPRRSCQYSALVISPFPSQVRSHFVIPHKYLLRCIYTMLQGRHNPLQNNPSPHAGSTPGHSYSGPKGGPCTAKGLSFTMLPRSSVGTATVPHNKLPHNLSRDQADKVLRAPCDTPGVLSLGVYRAQQDLLHGFELGHSQVELAINLAGERKKQMSDGCLVAGVLPKFSCAKSTVESFFHRHVSSSL